jgi:hypothetical protein
MPLTARGDHDHDDEDEEEQGEGHDAHLRALPAAAFRGPMQQGTPPQCACVSWRLTWCPAAYAVVVRLVRVLGWDATLAVRARAFWMQAPPPAPRPRLPQTSRRNDGASSTSSSSSSCSASSSSLSLGSETDERDRRRVAATWMDAVFMAVYEDVRTYLSAFVPADAARNKLLGATTAAAVAAPRMLAPGLMMRPTDYRRLGDLALRLGQPVRCSPSGCRSSM